ncbi:AI-2E family transporter [Vibrio sp. D431a]|nr:AI-2E family transporter [Vibrio sp. D431a]
MATLKSINGLVQPLLLSIILCLMLSPLVNVLGRYNVPRGLSASAILGALLVGTGTALGSLSKALLSFHSDIGHLTDKAQSFIHGLESSLLKQGVEVDIFNLFNFSHLPSFTMSIAGHIGGIMSTIFVVFLMTLFMLIEAPKWSEKFDQLISKGNSTDKILAGVNQYLAVKFLTSLSTGVLVGLSLAKIGHSYWFILGTIAFVFNYIPNVGSFLAAVPAVALAFVTLGVPEAALTILAYVVINVVIGSLLEPKIVGDKLGISTLVILLSMLVWGWMFGIVGMFLSVPITISAKMVLDEVSPDNPISNLLSN